MQDSSIWINLEIPVENKVEQVFVNKFIDWLLVPVRHHLHACLAFQWNKQQIPFPLQEISSFDTKHEQVSRTFTANPQGNINFGFHPKCLKSIVFESH